MVKLSEEAGSGEQRTEHNQTGNKGGGGLTKDKFKNW